MVNLTRIVVKPFADTPLSKLDKFTLQMHLNSLAEKHSHSVCQKFRVHMSAILEEAVEQDLIVKNPVRKLAIPQTRETCKRFLSTEEISDLIAAASPRDRLILLMFLVLGLRPGELFALRRNDVAGHQIMIDESASWRLELARPKTIASRASVWLPDKLAVELSEWMDALDDRDPEAFLFATSRGTPISHNNFLRRNIKRIVEAVLKARNEARIDTPKGYLSGVNHQAFRRTCATWAQQEGTVRDVQAMLRHSNPTMTAGTYMQAIPESVQRAVEALDERLRATVHNCSQVPESSVRK
jgi:integrase